MGQFGDDTLSQQAHRALVNFRGPSTMSVMSCHILPPWDILEFVSVPIMEGKDCERDFDKRHIQLEGIPWEDRQGD